MYQDYPYFFTATILEWKKRIAYKNLSHLCSQSAIDLFAAVGGLRHTYSGFGEHLQGLQYLRFLIFWARFIPPSAIFNTY